MKLITTQAQPNSQKRLSIERNEHINKEPSKDIKIEMNLIKK
jgi:hypothetical protein